MYKICPKIKNGIVADGSEKNQIALVFFFFLLLITDDTQKIANRAIRSCKNI